MALLEFTTGSTGFHPRSKQEKSLVKLTLVGLSESPHVLPCVLAEGRPVLENSPGAILFQHQMGLQSNSISIFGHIRGTRAIIFHTLTKYVSRQRFLPKSQCQKLSLYDLRDRKSARQRSAQTFSLCSIHTE